ncbi:conserved hypothetical protein [Theileria equi strain WA]|uniref:Acetyl-coenzyme A transporter 1 n=1 Tax=Theileria equi strain WA TaxID=1537102 RepID=L1LCK5_THEEQ|nr:conserved hypothetical protein [Theileria equi strain WA]EKX72980.1 conserved hypothetical protein [Theileria equi strain WA]|eukprot:XP_004832432.1 conserved hypothetical protein [Theileria equi strain WA]
MAYKYSDQGSVPFNPPLMDEEVENQEITKQDVYSILLLLLLYVIQGIPIGIRNAIPLVIHDRASYSSIALLSLTSLPYALKLLWAPILDFVYIQRLGKRKTWIIPTQFLCGLFLLYGSIDGKLDNWIGQDETVDTATLFIYFFIIYFLLATQDIAVDGWALTMLPPHLRIHSSTCNSAGQSLGINIAFMGFITLNSRDSCIRLYHFWNKICSLFGINYIPPDDNSIVPLVTLSGFCRFFGIIIILCTICVFFKRELDDKPILRDEVIELEFGTISQQDPYINEKNTQVLQSYKTLMKIIFLKPVRIMAFLLLTKKIFFSPEEPADLKLLGNGLPKDMFALARPILVPIEIIFPPIISIYINQYGASSVMLRGLYAHLLELIASTVFIVITGIYYKEERGRILRLLYYGVFISMLVFRQIVKMVINVADVAWFATVSDPKIGGTYMTLLNTFSNIGYLWPSSLAFLLVDPLG